MKILHTSDWHLGNQLYGYDRFEEQSVMLDTMVEIVREERPDVFLLCGDVFDVPQPSATVNRLFVEAITKIHDAHPEIVVVITAGNHDSASRHEVFRKPWLNLGVYSVGTVNIDSPENHIVEIPGKGWVIAVPYVNERNLPDGFIQNLINIVSEKNTTALPVVMTGHTTVRGCDFSGHTDIYDRRNDGETYTVGGIEGVKVEDMGNGYDYLALGHIHRKQYIHTGRHNVRYSGSPLPVSFDENFEHTVTILEIDRKYGPEERLPDIREIPIINTRPLITLPADGFTDWKTARTLLENLDDGVKNAYIRLNVEVEDFLPHGANEDANAIAASKGCRFCLINTRRKNAVFHEEKSLTVNEFRREDPLDIAIKYAKEIGEVFNEDMRKMFEEALRSIENE